MSIFSTLEFKTLEDLFIFELQDLYDAENRLIDGLPKMADAATSPKLKQAFMTHLDQTKRQASRLEQILGRMGQEVDRVTCDGMVGLIKECQDVIDSDSDPDVKDAALIGCAQRVEHYEIAGYGTARTFARRLGMNDAAELLQITLQEEGETDKRLTALAESQVNLEAVRK